MTKMTKWDRVQAALNWGDVDRIPISLWKHYHLQDRAPRRLAAVTLALYRQFDIDLIKLTPSGLYPIQDWGPGIRFGTDDDFLPQVVEPVITRAEQWKTLPRLDVTRGALERELETIHHLAAALDGEAPFMMSIFSPLTVAYKLCGDKVSGQRVLDDLRQSPGLLHAGLDVIADTVADYARECLQAGASGLFVATQMANYETLTAEEFREFELPYFLRVLEAVAGKSHITMLHLCKGLREMLDLVRDLPVDVINWADRATRPSLREARGATKKALAGGLSLETLLNGSEDDVRREALDAIEQTGGKGFILAPACVIKGPSPDRNLEAARRIVQEIGA